MLSVSRFFLAAILMTGLIAALGSGADDNSSSSFTPVAPARSLGRVVKLNLEQVERWCDENDLASAAQATQSTVLLATFLARQSGDKSKAIGDQLVRECNAIGAAARAKNMTQTRAGLMAANASLSKLLNQRSDGLVSWIDFKPSGNVRAWMVLLDGGYADAKIATEADDFYALALTLAEEANVVAELRKEPRWREMAHAARDAALASAKQSRQDLPGARQTLRTMFARCESCHQAYQR
jgi:hypothetical protein